MSEHIGNHGFDGHPEDRPFSRSASLVAMCQSTLACSQPAPVCSTITSRGTAVRQTRLPRSSVSCSNNLRGPSPCNLPGCSSTGRHGV